MRPRPPAWALASGLPRPEEGEEFRDYWSRCGVSDDTLDAIVAGLGGARDEVANERMSSYLARECPISYQEFIRAWSGHHRKGHSKASPAPL